jgi:hypothetical protein
VERLDLKVPRVSKAAQAPAEQPARRANPAPPVLLVRQVLPVLKVHRAQLGRLVEPGPLDRPVLKGRKALPELRGPLASRVRRVRRVK